LKELGWGAANLVVVVAAAEIVPIDEARSRRSPRSALHAWQRSARGLLQRSVVALSLQSRLVGLPFEAHEVTFLTK
jgi:hypothetical protein